MTTFSESRNFEIHPLRLITIFVVAFHAVLLMSLLWLAPSLPKPVKPKQLMIQTVQLTPKSRSQTKELAQAEVKPIAKPVPKKAEPAVKKETPKPVPKPIPKPVVKAPPKPAPKPVAKAEAKPKAVAKTAPEPPKKNIPSQASINALKAKLASIPTSATTLKAGNPGPEASFDLASAYEVELITRLKILFNLPEMGEVKVDLTLNRQGRVVKVEIKSFANAVNKKAVETHLPSMQFPAFGQAFVGETTHTFKLTLTNL